MHDLAQQSTYTDLLVEYYEDVFEEQPSEARKTLGKDGEFVFGNLEDPLLAKWEKEWAQGIAPDLEEGLSERVKAQLKKERESRKQSDGVEGFEDDYKIQKTGKKKESKYDSKFVQPGSDEERELLHARARRKAANQDVFEDIKDMLMGTGDG